jgi:hypothetical protein
MVSSGLLRRVTLVITSSRATRRNNPEDTILHSHRRENLKSYNHICSVTTNDNRFTDGWGVQPCDLATLYSPETFLYFSGTQILLEAEYTQNVVRLEIKRVKSPRRNSNPRPSGLYTPNCRFVVALITRHLPSAKVGTNFAVRGCRSVGTVLLRTNFGTSPEFWFESSSLFSCGSWN